ncbi:hypothetical protein SPAB_02764 [Salmonella enterica subsp. enterica serovar Paratyphi B str. SPB7]|uniref:Uncharacterized protein n=1 Tax=Salmonella paratyphi B (strain ATCC BAA-1250 / SPB7) TaxID=1016998 RepID=A0A6C6Z4R4_SALPB|nr:hypothetical protein SPAB_02764 [Salmonella enterica subsp. enterica serovar Paratyphi B str. SPB7]
MVDMSDNLFQQCTCQSNPQIRDKKRSPPRVNAAENLAIIHKQSGYS